MPQEVVELPLIAKVSLVIIVAFSLLWIFVIQYYISDILNAMFWIGLIVIVGAAIYMIWIFYKKKTKKKTAYEWFDEAYEDKGI